jgi:hypothetical protein
MIINDWSATPTGVGVSLMSKTRDIEVCVAYVSGHYVINVFKPGTDKAIKTITIMESEVEYQLEQA